MKRTAISFLLLLLGFCGLAQDIQVTGTVRSSEGTPLAGVTILDKSTGKGTNTDKSGKFSLQVASNATLEFSFIGYVKQELALNGRRELSVQLALTEGTELGEVVVTTALGIKKQQKTLGYAVQEVSGETMAKTKTPTPLAALTGKVAGLNINNTTDLFRNPGISLRGRTPLIVIDGIPDPDADPYKINADDIESISVLKGPAAGALYGALGVNGAI
ncbi:carboxypeptidase-like regulatory domain-containing protein, partial [Flavihumibacter sp. CACIAM 22H1]|uniref:carboxypeptidase-like regulatory domain-containing protein n=1 Tax=Flavihumibacter sp. CACIAM 22H1 TaxID=1812911 RepID=UPI0025BA3800